MSEDNKQIGSNFTASRPKEVNDFSSQGQKNISEKQFSKKALFILLICILGCILTLYSVLAFDMNEPSSVLSLNLHSSTEQERNIEICSQIAADYYKNHYYSEDDIYDCDNMAQDVWNMLKAREINARIATADFKPKIKNQKNGPELLDENSKPEVSTKSGQPGKIISSTYILPDTDYLDSEKIDNLTHAWVLAEVSPDSWLALECTGGYIVSSEENKSYYRGLTFSNPKNYRDFFELYRIWKIQAQDYENERFFYNQMVKTYNNASYFEKTAMESSMKFAEKSLQEKEKKFLETDSKLKSLLCFG